MLTMRTQAINVTRLALLEALKVGRTLHEDALREAVADYQAAAITFLAEATARVQRGDFTKVHFKLQEPQSNLQKYDDMIDMFSVSVDETINLDMESYKAYYKNEWPWTNSFLEAAQGYKAFLGAAGGAI